MGQITVEKMSAVLKDSASSPRPSTATAADILWKHTIRKTWKRQDFTWSSCRTISPAPRRVCCAACIFKKAIPTRKTGARHPRIRL